jgi:HEAT repeat protein
VRAAAAVALRRLNWSAATDEEQALFDVATGNIRAAALKGEAALSSLLIELQHHFSCKRRAAAEALEMMNDYRRVKPLLRATSDEDPSVRVWAAHALSQENTHEVRATFGKLLRNPNAHVRLAAAQALANRADPGERSCFVELLRDTNFEVRLTAVQFLAKFPDPQNAQVLLSVLGDPDCDVRHATAKALGLLRSPYTIEALVVALGDEDRLVRQTAETSLEQIDPEWMNSSAAQRAIGKLEAAQERCPPWVRSSIGQVVSRLRAHSPMPNSITAGAVWVQT